MDFLFGETPMPERRPRRRENPLLLKDVFPEMAGSEPVLFPAPGTTTVNAGPNPGTMAGENTTLRFTHSDKGLPKPNQTPSPEAQGSMLNLMSPESLESDNSKEDSEALPPSEEPQIPSEQQKKWSYMADRRTLYIPISERRKSECNLPPVVPNTMQLWYHAMTVHKVSPQVNSTDRRRNKFYSRVMLVKFAQVSAIGLWLLWQEVMACLPGSDAGPLSKYYSISVYFPMGFYFLFQLIMRCWVYRKKRLPSWTFTLIMNVILTICVAYTAGVLTIRYSINQCVIFQCIFTLTGATGTLAIQPYTTPKQVDGAGISAFLYGMMAVVLWSLVGKFVSEVCQTGKIGFDNSTLFRSHLIVFVPAFLGVLYSTFEIWFAIKGKRFDLKNRDWLFVALLL